MARNLRPFPFPINIGTDICQISRIYTILNSPRRTRFVNRILAPEEVSRHDERLNPKVLTDGDVRCLTHGDVKASPLWKTAAFMAGFAAKEAAIKAHSNRRLTFHDVIIERRGGRRETLGSGPPVARIRGGEGGDVSALVSISHDGDYATAVCVAHDESVQC
ncbi:holo-acyl-carrier-protein synthase [Pochonia chlamydosporia 170]|uniref:Holo-acyl-carrier-protein synthase n=1 Tax=Pochonia chlamydosporia 170 TaxID=1380566 RepID=A0A179FC68_METCM|nr:holo-acyl-carrier-protein synthase [Pochonia chlamydosporia 170]OAQ63072.2 holo-acyl-carrier-protein synthase [Pochonia chlamydosporia 170]